VDRVEVFLCWCRARGYTCWLSARGVAPLLGFLRGLGVAPGPRCESPATAAEALLGRYRTYLARERGLAASTIGYYSAEARLFLDRVAGADLGGLAGLAAGEVSRFVSAECRGRGTGSAKILVTALRSLLRFLLLDGLVAADLAAAVPRWRAGGVAGCRRHCLRGRYRPCWALVTGKPQSARVITRWSCYWPGWACGPARRPRWNWTTSTGGPGP